MEHIKRVGRTLKHKGSILSFYEDDIMTPDGNVAKWDFIGAQWCSRGCSGA